MGLFSGVGDFLGGATGGLLGGSGIFSGIGSMLNDITGATASAKQAQKYTQQNMAKSQGYTLEQMAQEQKNTLAQMAQDQKYVLAQMAQNYAYEKQAANSAHQWAMKDLAAAGLNPILAATDGANLGGSVSGGSVSGGGTGGSMAAPAGATGQSGIDLITAISSAKKALAESNLTTVNEELAPKIAESQIEKNQAETNKLQVEAGLMPASAKAAIKKSNAETTYIQGPKTWETNEKGWSYIHENQRNDAERDYINRKASGKGVDIGGKLGKNGMFGSGNIGVHW